MDIFHYTSRDAALNIIKGNSFWLSRYDAMNDTTEMRHIDDFLIDHLSLHVDSVFRGFPKEKRKIINKICKQEGIPKFSVYHAEALVKNIRAVLFDGKEELPKAVNPFILSFCRHAEESYEYYNGMLSQWRAYGRAGYCLVFDKEDIRSLISAERSRFLYTHFDIHDVVYGFGGEKFLIDHRDLVKIAEKAVVVDGRHPNVEELFQKLSEEYIKCAVKFKHVGFKEECEIRVVLSPGSIEFKDILERHGPPIRMPVKEIKFRSDGRGYIESIFDQILPIKRVIVSPGENQNELHQEMDELLNGKVVITKSSTPYIERSTVAKVSP